MTSTPTAPTVPSGAMKWGLAGYGDLPHRRIVPALYGAGQQLVGVWGRNLQRTRAFAAAHQIGVAAESLDDLCRQVDAVYIALPVSAHVPAATTALAHDCHVLIEKPLNVGLHKIEALIETSRQRDLRVGVAYYRRLAPATLRLSQLIGEGALGALQHITVDFCAPFEPAPDHPMYWRTDLSIAGAGVLADAGSHRIDLLSRLLGPATLEQAQLDDLFPGGAERYAAIELRFPQGARADCRFSWRSPTSEADNESGGGARDRLHLRFDQGTIEIAPLDPGVIRITHGGQTRVEEHPPFANPHQALIQDFVDAVRLSRDPVCPVDQALWTDSVICDTLHLARP